jgi:hypothetical protein
MVLRSLAVAAAAAAECQNDILLADATIALWGEDDADFGEAAGDDEQNFDENPVMDDKISWNDKKKGGRKLDDFHDVVPSYERQQVDDDSAALQGEEEDAKDVIGENKNSQKMMLKKTAQDGGCATPSTDGDGCCNTAGGDGCCKCPKGCCIDAKPSGLQGEFDKYFPKSSDKAPNDASYFDKYFPGEHDKTNGVKTFDAYKKYLPTPTNGGAGCCDPCNPAPSTDEQYKAYKKFMPRQKIGVDSDCCNSGMQTSAGTETWEKVKKYMPKQKISDSENCCGASTDASCGDDYNSMKQYAPCQKVPADKWDDSGCCRLKDGQDKAECERLHGFPECNDCEKFPDVPECDGCQKLPNSNDCDDCHRLPNMPDCDGCQKIHAPACDNDCHRMPDGPDCCARGGDCKKTTLKAVKDTKEAETKETAPAEPKAEKADPAMGSPEEFKQYMPTDNGDKAFQDQANKSLGPNHRRMDAELSEDVNQLGAENMGGSDGFNPEASARDWLPKDNGEKAFANQESKIFGDDPRAHQQQQESEETEEEEQQDGRQLYERQNFHKLMKSIICAKYESGNLNLGKNEEMYDGIIHKICDDFAKEMKDDVKSEKKIAAKKAAWKKKIAAKKAAWKKAQEADEDECPVVHHKEISDLLDWIKDWKKKNPVEEDADEDDQIAHWRKLGKDMRAWRKSKHAKLQGNRGAALKSWKERTAAWRKKHGIEAKHVHELHGKPVVLGHGLGEGLCNKLKTAYNKCVAPCEKDDEDDEDAKKQCFCEAPVESKEIGSSGHLTIIKGAYNIYKHMCLKSKMEGLAVLELTEAEIAENRASLFV